MPTACTSTTWSADAERLLRAPLVNVFAREPAKVPDTLDRVDLEWAGVWAVGSFLLGQSVIFGGVVLNNRAQAKREAAAREAARLKVLEERRDDFELRHLQDLHEAVSGLLVVAEDNILAWCRWHRLGEARPTLRRPQEDIDRDRQACRDEADALESIAKTHGASIDKLVGLVLDDRLRNKVRRAHGLYQRFDELLPEDGPAAAEAALPEALSQLHAARGAVAARIREIYVSW